jgi:hypothetical protein
MKQPTDPDHPDVNKYIWEPVEGEPDNPPPSPETDGVIFLDERNGLAAWECRRCPELGTFNWNTSAAVVMAHVRWHKLPLWRRLFTPRPGG